MKKESKITAGQEGMPLKKVMNFDEETYSIVTRPEYFPTRVKVPKKVILERHNILGHPYFIDFEDYAWSAYQTSVYKTNLDDNESVLVVDTKTLDPLSVNVEFCMRTLPMGDNNGNIIVSTVQNTGTKEGGRLYLSSDNGVTWNKVLDSEEQGVVAYFRSSNIWYHEVMGNEIIFVASYGGPQDSLNTKGNNMLFVSRDQGMTWAKIFELPLVQPGTNNHMHSICVSPFNGWLWLTHGDGLNRGIIYSHDALYNDTPTFTVISEGEFGKGGWQPSSVVPTASGVAFGTDTGEGLPNGVLAYDIPETTKTGKIGFKHQILHDDAKVHISRRGAVVNGLESYIPMMLSNPSALKIFGTGDGGFSWHEVATLKFGAFEKGFTNPDREGYIYGSSGRLKVEWEEVTQWIKDRYVEKIGYI